MIEKIERLRFNFDNALTSPTLSQVKDLRHAYLGRKGHIPALMKALRDVPLQDKANIGKRINDFKNHVETRVLEKISELESSSDTKDLKSVFDTTLPGRQESIGSMHPVSQVMEEIINIFYGLGFNVEEGPEIENDYYNFEALNIPKNHPFQS